VQQECGGRLHLQLRREREMGHSIAPIPPLRYLSILNKHVILFSTP